LFVMVDIFRLPESAGSFLSDAGVEGEANQDAREEPVGGIGFGADEAEPPDRTAALAFAVAERDKVQVVLDQRDIVLHKLPELRRNLEVHVDFPAVR